MSDLQKIAESDNIRIRIQTPSHPQSTVLQSIRRSTGVSRHPELRTRGFCWSKILLPTCRCWRQLAHMD